MTASPRTSTAPTGTSPRSAAAPRLLERGAHEAHVRPRLAHAALRRLRRRRRQKQRRIDEVRVERHAEVQVRPGHAPGRPDLADHRARRDALARVHADCAQVAVHGDETRAVIEDHRVAVEEEVARIDDAAIRRRVHRRAGVGGDVHAAVRDCAAGC